MFEQLAPEIQDTVVTIVLAVLGLLSSFLIALAKKGFDWLGTKIESIKSDEARKLADKAICDLQDLVATTVTSLQQTLGDQIKASITAGDGKFTYEDLAGLKDKAFKSIKAQLTVAAQDALATTYADVDAFIYDLIEKQVYTLKHSFVSEGLLLSE